MRSVSRICWPYLASLFSPTPLTVPSSASVVGRRRRDLAQRRVVEDDVRRHALLLRRGGPPGPQPLEDRRRLGGQLGGGGPPLAAARPRRARSGSRRSITSRSPRSTSALRVGEHQRAVVALDREQALRQQLADDAAPLGLAQLGADAEDGQRVVAVLDDLVGAAGRAGCRSTGRRRTSGCARAAAGSTVDSSFCAGDRAVPRLRRRQAGVAVAARARSAAPK